MHQCVISSDYIISTLFVHHIILLYAYLLTQFVLLAWYYIAEENALAYSRVMSQQQMLVHE